MLLLAPSLAFSAQTTISPPASQLVKEINDQSGVSFKLLLEDWSKRYGTLGVAPLLNIAKDRRNTDRQRYVALMGAAKLGGPAVATKIVPLLKDRIWMIRGGALKALAALKNPKTAKAVLPLLKDPALVVRVDAVEAVKALRPAGASQALLRVLHSQENYRFGKAQWVPIRALAALVVLQDRSVVPELRPLLDHKKDPDLQRQTIFALETLTGIQNDPKLTLKAQIASWKKILAGGDSISSSAAHPAPEE